MGIGTSKKYTYFSSSERRVGLMIFNSIVVCTYGCMARNARLNLGLNCTDKRGNWKFHL